ncbi:MAG: sulfatase-like hydrolase/transferase [Chitinophagaceae bacterium]
MNKYIIAGFFAVVSMPNISVSAQKPNVVFILADDMGYGDAGFTGQKKIQTPNLDAYASEGIVFNDFYAGAPVCSPSRFCLITGRNMGHATIRGNGTIQGGIAGHKGKQVVPRANILPSDSTIGNLMTSAGYVTGLMGKWHIDGYDTLATPSQHGFNDFKGWLISQPETYVSTYWPEKWWDNGHLIDIPQNKNGRKGYYTCDIITDESIDFLSKRKKDGKPFFLMVNHSNPHSPLDAPIHPFYKDSSWDENLKTYASMVTYLDESVAKIIRFLQKSGLDKNTIVLFTSDNGPRSEPTPELTRVATFFQSAGPLRGYKRDLTEGGIREPFFAWSGIKGFANGTQVDEPAYFPDLLPTLGGIASFKNIQSYPTEGKDLSKFLFASSQKTSTATSKDRFLYWEFFEGGYKQAVRFGKWKALIVKKQIQLYDLSKDAGEKNDLAGVHPDVVEKIRDFLETCRTESPYWPTTTQQ